MRGRRHLRLWLTIAMTLLCVLSMHFATPTAAALQCGDPVIHVVQSGETLSAIALNYGVTQSAIMNANGIADPNRIYAGQQLTIPTCGDSGASAPAPAASAGQGVHVVQAGETLSGIATRYGVSVSALMQVNGISDPNLIYVGQSLTIPAGGSAAPAAPAAPPASAPATAGGKLIEVNLSTQWMYAYSGDQLIYSSGVSTGRDGWNTPTGTFKIYTKYEIQDMSGSANGESWYVPGVPHAMYFYGGVALHGTYWHNLFGTGVRLSHGCVNLPLDVASALYYWAPVGTTVWVHY